MDCVAPLSKASLLSTKNAHQLYPFGAIKNRSYAVHPATHLYKQYGYSWEYILFVKT